MVAIVLGSDVPSAQPDLALLVAAPVLRYSEGVSWSVPGTFPIPPTFGLTDLTPVAVIGDGLNVGGFDVLDGSEWTPRWQGPDEGDVDNGAITMWVSACRGWSNASTAAAAAAAIRGRGSRRGRRG